MATQWIDQDALPPASGDSPLALVPDGRRLRILICAWRDLAHQWAGGSEVLIDRIACGMTRRGHDVTLLAGGPVEEREYRTIHSGGTYSQYLSAPLRYLANFRDSDLVVDVCNGMPFLVPAWRRKPSICFVNHVHTDQWAAWFPPAVAAMGRTIESRAMPFAYRHHLFVAVSPSTAEALEGLGVDADRIRIVPNGVDLPEKTLEKSREPLFLAVGRLVPHKRVDLLLRVWDRVREQVGGRLVIVGSGPEQRALAAAAGPGVELRGQVSEAEKHRLLGEAWFLVHPSMLEGWGLVIMEAAAAGTPALGFRVPGVRDSIVDGVSGVLVDSEAGLAREWAELSADHARRAAMATAAKRVAAEYSWTRTVDAFEAVALEATAAEDAVQVLPVSPSSPAKKQRRLQVAPSVSRPDVSVIVPAFNESLRLTRSLPLLLDALANIDAELVVVDDGSTDGTAEVASRALRSDPRATVLRMRSHRGKGEAVRTGVAHALGDAIVFMDADLATDLEELPKVVAELDRYHVVVGSRAAAGAVTIGGSKVRAHMGRVFNHFARDVTGVSVADFQCGFKAFRAPAAKVLFHLSQLHGFAFDVEILMLADQIGYRIAELPVRWQAVPGGHVRPTRDAPLMAADVLRTRIRWTRRRVLAAIEASCDGQSAPADAVAALEARLRGFDPVVPWHDGALGFLPFVDIRGARTVAARIQEELPEFSIHADAIPAWELLSPSATSLRHALAVG